MLLPYADNFKNDFEADFLLNEPMGRLRHSILDQNDELNLQFHRSFNIDPNYYKDEERAEDHRGFARESGSSFRRQNTGRRPHDKLPPGAKRRKGAGRKTVNPQMEVDLIEWVQNYLIQNSNLIRKLSKAQRHHRASQAISELELQGLERLVR